MKYFNNKIKVPKVNILIKFWMIINPLYRLRVYPKASEETIKEIQKLDHEFGLLEEDYVALNYEAVTGRDLFSDTIKGALIGALSVIVIIATLVFTFI